MKRASPMQDRLVEVLQSAGKTAFQAAQALGVDAESVRVLLRRMVASGKLVRREVPGVQFHGFRSRVGALGRNGVWLYELPAPPPALVEPDPSGTE